MDPRILPPRALERARTYLQSRPAVPPPRDSASVLLVRDDPSGFEVCTILRHHAMATSGGVLVFPGGLVDQQDADVGTPWAGGEPKRWAEVLELDVATARAVVTAAIRELFEETGVLLAGELWSRDHVVPQRIDGWVQSRARLEAHEETFAAFLARRGWGIRADLLHLWSTWLTPEFEPRRYRARFFVAELPAGHAVHDGSTEAAELRWDRPGALLDGARAETLQLLAPQYCLCLELGQHQRVADLVEMAARVPRPLVSPQLEIVDGVPRLRLPEDLVDPALRM